MVQGYNVSEQGLFVRWYQQQACNIHKTAELPCLHKGIKQACVHLPEQGWSRILCNALCRARHHDAQSHTAVYASCWSSLALASNSSTLHKIAII